MPNRFVLTRAIPAAFALSLAVFPAQAKMLPVQKGVNPALAQNAKTTPAPARSAVSASAYASADSTCQRARRRLWTETGWIVRRVPLCR